MKLPEGGPLYITHAVLKKYMHGAWCMWCGGGGMQNDRKLLISAEGDDEGPSKAGAVRTGSAIHRAPSVILSEINSRNEYQLPITW